MPAYAVKRLKAKLEYTNIAHSLLPEEFTFAELEQLYAVILSRPIDRRNSGAESWRWGFDKRGAGRGAARIGRRRFTASRSRACKPSRCYSGSLSMSASTKRKLNSWVIVIVVVAGGGRNLWRPEHLSFTRRRVGTGAAGRAAAAQHLRMTLDPNQFVGEVKQAYLIAESDPALLAQLHCYCGCDRTDGHKNLPRLLSRHPWLALRDLHRRGPRS